MALDTDLVLVEQTRTQSLVREVNERARALADGAKRVDYLCECGDAACAAPVVLATDEYDAVRRFPTRFVVLPRHRPAEYERVIERNERYAVVEKFGESGKIAVRLDPRRRRLSADLT